MGKHDKPASDPQPSPDPPGNGDGVPADVTKPGGGDHKKK